MSAVTEFALPGAELLDPERFVRDGYSHAERAHLRGGSPVRWCPRDEGEPPEHQSYRELINGRFTPRADHASQSHLSTAASAPAAGD